MKNPISIKMEVLGGISYVNSPTAYTHEQTEAFAARVKSQSHSPEQEVIDFIVKYGSGRFNAVVRIPPKDLSVAIPWNCFHIHSIASRDVVQISSRFLLLFHGEGDSIVYYSLEPQSLGKIFYWRHENGVSHPPVLLANSFKECIMALYSHDRAPVYTSNRTLLPG